MTRSRDIDTRDRATGQVIERGDKVWLVRVFVGRIAGKRQYVSRTVHGTKREARSVLTKMLHDRDKDRLMVPSRLTLTQYLEEWQQKALKGRVTPRTFAVYVDHLKRYVLPILGDERLTAVTPLDVQGVYSEMLARGLSARTVRHTHAVLRNALKQAVKWRILASNPADAVELPKGQRIEQQALTAEQVAAFLRAVEGSPWKALYHLLLNTGLRPGEAFALQWRHVDLANGELVVRYAVTYDEEHRPVLRDPKTAKSRRRVSFTQDLARVLFEHRDATRDIANPLGLVFPTLDGRLIHPNHWSKVDFKSALKRAGIPRSVRLYDLRHSMATLALEAGIHPKVVSERLGHSTTQLTLDTYSHVTPTMQDQASEALGGLIYDRKPSGAARSTN